MCEARADTVYFEDLNRSAIESISPAGQISEFASFNGIDGGMTCDSAGDLYVNGLKGIFKVGPTGIPNHLAVSMTSAGGDLAIDSTGVIFAGINESQIISIAPTGLVSPFVSSTEHGLAFDQSNSLYVSIYDPTNHSPIGEIAKVDRSGNTTIFASSLPSPNGLAFDAHGNLFAAEMTTGVIDEISPTGVVTRFAAGLQSPLSLAFSSSGDLYVSNFNPSGFSSIDRITPDGTVTAFASGLTGLGSIGVQVPEPASAISIGPVLTILKRRRPSRSARAL